MADAPWPSVQYGSPPPSDLDDTISDEEDAAYEYDSQAESEAPSEEWPSDSEAERKELGVAGPRDSDEENQYRPDGLEPADVDSRYNNVRYQIRSLMYAVRRYKKGRTGYSSFEQLWEVWGKSDFLPFGFLDEGWEEDLEREDVDMGEAWWITANELRKLIRLAETEGYEVPTMYAGGLEKWRAALLHAPEELPPRREIDPENPPDFWY